MKKIVSSIAIAAMLISGSMAYAEEGKHLAPPAGLDVHFGFPGTQGLNELLVKKGIVTKEELEAQAKKHSMNIAGYIQVQGSIIGNNDELTNEASPKSFADEDGFRIRRAKLAVFGYAYEHVKFKLEANFAGTPVLDDAYIEDDRLPFFIGRLGQFKVPFSLEELTSDTEILSIERSEVVKQIAPGRDQGISFSGVVTGGLLSYSIGAYNGTKAGTATTYSIGAYEDAAKNATRNDNDQLLYAGRLVVKPLEWLNIGFSGLTSTEGTGALSMNHNAYGIDLQVKNPKRGCSLQGEYLRQWLKNNTTDITTTSDGFYVQAGHFLVEKHLEAVVKYEEYDSNKDVADRDDIKWVTVGLNFYIYGNHDAKLMANYIVKDEKQNGYNNNTFLTQLQLRF